MEKLIPVSVRGFIYLLEYITTAHYSNYLRIMYFYMSTPGPQAEIPACMERDMRKNSDGRYEHAVRSEKLGER
jgi:hypothetical protein